MKNTWKWIPNTYPLERDKAWPIVYRGVVSWGSMTTGFPRGLITLALAICFVCPLVEMFDQWDHTMQTGNDTEYALVVLALCVGAAYTFARAIFIIIGTLFSKGAYAPKKLVLTFSGALLTSIVRAAISASPPLTTLRI